MKVVVRWFSFLKLLVILFPLLVVGCKTQTSDSAKTEPSDSFKNACTVVSNALGVEIDCGDTTAQINHGSDGANGANGAAGPTGATGPTGPQGVAGANGTNGSNGVQGPTGPQGPIGPAGAPAGSALRLRDANGNTIGDYLISTAPRNQEYTVWDADNEMLVGYVSSLGGIGMWPSQDNAQMRAYFTTANCSGDAYVYSNNTLGYINRGFRGGAKVYKIVGPISNETVIATVDATTGACNPTNESG